MINIKVRNHAVSISAKDFLIFFVQLVVFILLFSCNVGTYVLAGLQIAESPIFAWLKWCMVCATVLIASGGLLYIMICIIGFVNRIFNV